MSGIQYLIPLTNSKFFLPFLKGVIPNKLYILFTEKYFHVQRQ